MKASEIKVGKCYTNGIARRRVTEIKEYRKPIPVKRVWFISLDGEYGGEEMGMLRDNFASWAKSEVPSPKV